MDLKSSKSFFDKDSHHGLFITDLIEFSNKSKLIWAEHSSYSRFFADIFFIFTISL